MKTTVIEMKNIVKTFPGVKALDNMTLDLYEGEIHCLVGENGAGKSTLMKVLSGAYIPDSGDIIVDKNSYKHMTTVLAKELGISIIYQENLLVPWMNVVENIFVGHELSKNGFVNYKKEFAEAEELCNCLGICLSLNKTIADLSVAEQQFVKILKALSTNPRILIMDEPTSMFNTEEAKRVLGVVSNIAKRGVSIIYISHFLKEVKKIADRITVIRDGKQIRSYDNKMKDVKIDLLVKDMVGREASLFYEKGFHEIGEKAFEVINLKLNRNAPEINFYVNKGEILGIAGMVGAGRTEMVDAITGVTKKYSGRIFINGKEIKINNPINSIKNKIAYITENRQELGLMLEAPVIDNLLVVAMQTKIKGIFIKNKKYLPKLKNIIEDLKIKMSSPFQEVKNLSGGNQQKVVLGKWLFTDNDIFIFDEPTRGIDVNAKSEFYKIITHLAKEGKSIILISSDMPEIVSMSDRLAVMRKGKIVKILEKNEISEEEIIQYALEVNSKCEVEEAVY